MTSLIPPFDFNQVIVLPWTQHVHTFGWIVLMGFLCTAACGLVGVYLMLRRMALVGDAISHSILPGIVIAFLVAGNRDSMGMFIGALTAGIVTTVLIQSIHSRSRIKQDAAIGIVFSSLFAIGVVLISLYADQVDLDADCVLYGEIGYVSSFPFVSIGTLPIAPLPVFIMGVVALLTLALILFFYKELLVTSFDSGLAHLLGLNTQFFHYALMALLSVVVVSAFESVGAILVIAMLILPGATAMLLSSRLSVILYLTSIHAALSSVMGMHLGVWLDCSIAAAMVVAGGALFLLAWILHPGGGLLWRLGKKRKPTLALNPNTPLEPLA